MSDSGSKSDLKLGVNGFGRIGKLTVWHHVARKYFKEIVVNIGRQAGTSLEDIAHYVQRDSTYGRLQTYLHGQNAQPVVEAVDDKSGSMVLDGTRVIFLRSNRWWRPPASSWTRPCRRNMPRGH